MLSKPQGVLQPEGLGKLKNISSGLEPTTFQVAARYHVPPMMMMITTATVTIKVVDNASL
jgi:hypothetical protein